MRCLVLRQTVVFILWAGVAGAQPSARPVAGSTSPDMSVDREDAAPIEVGEVTATTAADMAMRQS